MAEGAPAGGHSVGTVYLRVVPYLDQAAMAQVSQQAGAAAGGFGGGGAPGAGAVAAQARAAAAGAAGSGAVTAIIQNRFYKGSAAVFGGDGGFASPTVPGHFPILGPGGGGRGRGGGFGGGGGGWGPGAEWMDAFGDLGRAVPPPLPQRTGIGFRDAFSSSIAGRGGTGVWMNALFGGWEAGMSYNAYRESLAPINNASPLQSMRSARQAVDTASSGMLGSVLTMAMRRREDGGWVANAIDAVNPFVGMAFDHYAGPKAFARMDAAQAEAEQSVRDVESMRDRGIARRKGTREADYGYTRAAIRSSGGGSVERRLLGFAADATEAQATFTDTMLDFNARAMAEQDPREGARIRADMNAYEVWGGRQAGAAAAAAKAGAEETIREAKRNYASVRREGRVLSSLAAGQYGLAAERQFGNKLDDDQAEADAMWGPLGDLMSGINEMRRGARRGMQKEDARGAAVEARAYGMMSRGDTLGAIRERGAYAEDFASRSAPPGHEEVYAARERARSSLEYQNELVSRGATLESLTRRRDFSATLADPRYGFAAASAMARVNDVYSAARSGANNAMLNGDPAAARLISEGGAADLSAMRRQIMSGGAMQEVSPLRFAPGGGEMLEVLRKIEENTRDLQNTSGATAQ
jgi:hypothetical protein